MHTHTKHGHSIGLRVTISTMCPGREGTAIFTPHTESRAQRGAIISDDHTGHRVSLEPKAQLQSDLSHDRVGIPSRERWMTLCQQRFTLDKECSCDEGQRACPSVGGLHTCPVLGSTLDILGSLSLCSLRAQGAGNGP